MMRAKFTGSVLVATLVFSGASALRAEAHPLVTTFRCVQEGQGFATIAERGDRKTPPLIIWNTILGTYTPKERCNTVSRRLTQVVTENGGKLQNLQLAAGTVKNQAVICAVNNGQSACNRSNMLFTLQPENARNPNAVVATLQDFSVKGSGAPIDESYGQHTLALKQLDQFLGSEDKTNSATSPSRAKSLRSNVYESRS